MATRTISIARRAAAAAIALLFALALTLASAASAHASIAYDLWVGGVRVTSDNASDVLGDGSVVFTPGSGDTYELTLDDAHIDIADVPGSSIDAAGIYTENDLVITVTGSRSMITPGSAATNSNVQAIEADNSANVTIKGDGDLYIQVRDYESAGGFYGVWGHGFLDVAEDVAVTINSSDSIANIFAIAMDKGVHVGDNAALNIYAGSHGSNSYGIWGKKITFDGNSKTIVNAQGTARNNAGIWSNGTVTIEGAASVRLNARDAGIEANNINVSGNGVAIVQANKNGAFGFKLNNSSGKIVINGRALVAILTSGQAFSHVPDTADHYDPCAYVGMDPGHYTLVEEITSSNYENRYVQIPGKPIIHRIAGDYANETAAKISQFMMPSEMMLHGSAVVLARDDDFADALGATGLAGALDAPILLTDRETLSPATAAEINRIGAYEIYIIGGPGAMKEQLEKDLVEQCGVFEEDIIRVYGENSYDTSLECAKEIEKVSGKSDTAIIAMSTNFQDALSMSPIAYKWGCPVILQTWGATSDERGFTDEAKAFLADKDLFVAGGTGAISDASLEGLYVAERLWGETGYDTSEAIAEWAVFEEEILDPYAAVIACGAQAPKGTDALAGAALAGMYGAPILLVNGNEAMEAANTVTIDNYLKNCNFVKECYVLGGTYVVPPELFAKIQETINAHEAINM